MNRRLIIASGVLLSLASGCSAGDGATATTSGATHTTAATSTTTTPQVEDTSCATCLDPRVQPTVEGNSTTVPGPTPLTLIVKGSPGSVVNFSVRTDGGTVRVGPSGVWTDPIQVPRNSAVVLSAYDPGPDGPGPVAYAIAYHGLPLLRAIIDSNTGPHDLTVLVQ